MSGVIKIIDVVNLNADASCLSSKWWLKMLEGKDRSYFCEWLNTYIDAGKKISLGITGATAADLSIHNPEAIETIRRNPAIFEIILRPFSHDIALLRLPVSFLYNLDAGRKTLEKEFGKVMPFYLPPEFMLTNEQVKQLSDNRVKGVFINADRFKPEIKNRLPETPYVLKGIFDSSLNCVPFNGALTQGYLNGIHYFNARSWNRIISATRNKINFCWRDGESSFFLPDGNNREKAWLAAESNRFVRVFISEALEDIAFENNTQLKEKQYHHYPVHSFTAWMKEMKMMGYVQRLFTAEQDFEHFSDTQKAIWLQAVNSDILSAIEKDSPVISILKSKNSKSKIHYTIWRSERGTEGEEYLALLEKVNLPSDVAEFLRNSVEPHFKKLRGRISYLSDLRDFQPVS